MTSECPIRQPPGTQFCLFDKIVIFYLFCLFSNSPCRAGRGIHTHMYGKVKQTQRRLMSRKQRHCRIHTGGGQHRARDNTLVNRSFIQYEMVLVIMITSNARLPSVPQSWQQQRPPWRAAPPPSPLAWPQQTFRDPPRIRFSLRC